MKAQKGYTTLSPPNSQSLLHTENLIVYKTCVKKNIPSSKRSASTGMVQADENISTKEAHKAMHPGHKPH